MTTSKKMQGKNLFTPGPLCVSQTTKEAMLQDLGLREPEFEQVIRDVRNGLLKLAGVSPPEYVCVPMQGCGTMGLEAVFITTVAKKGGRVLILENGAYGLRQVTICARLGIPYHHESFGERKAIDPERVAEILHNDPNFTHVSMVHCETSTGAINNIHSIGEVIKKHAPDAVYFVDAMSTFGAVPLNMKDSHIDYMVSSSNKCIQGVPGFCFVLCKLDHLLKCKGNSQSLSLDLVDQYEGLEANGQFRFTAPTHVLLAFRQAMNELDQEGGVQARSSRYQENRQCLREGMRKMGFVEFLPESIAGYIITSYLYPKDPNFNFTTFFKLLCAKGQVIYHGQLTKAECFRLGNIGDLYPADMEELLTCIQQTCEEMGIKLPLS